jgi:hypothetical protein
MVMLSGTNWAQTDTCEIVNGSFEDDGLISDITAQEPNAWDVNIPSGKFVARTDGSWSTDGSFSLFVQSQWFTAFAAGDMATVSQQVRLADVNEIMFDVKLDTYSLLAWDPNIATAVMLVDGDVVWEPNGATSDLRGEYLDQAYAVEDKYRDENSHTLSVGVRINVDEPGLSFERYRVWWDSIGCTLFCNGGGLLAGDFNHDCNVDINDLKLAAAAWLSEVPSYDRHNLFREDDLPGYGTINFFDLAIFADNWLRSSYKDDRDDVVVTANGHGY